MPEEGTRGYLKAVAKGLLSLPLVMALIFLLAGRLDYWQGWAFSIYMCSRSVVASAAFSRRPDVIRERFGPGPGTVWWDRIFWALYGPLTFIVAAVAVLDAGRFGWGGLPLSLCLAGYVLLALSDFLKCWAMWVNRFFSTTVRIQMERGHVVVRDGPYRFIRHPGYLAGILMTASISMALGSLWGLVPAVAVAALLVVRTHLEDRYLQEKLRGYANYARRVRYRLLPGIW